MPRPERQLHRSSTCHPTITSSRESTPTRANGRQRHRGHRLGRVLRRGARLAKAASTPSATGRRHQTQVRSVPDDEWGEGRARPVPRRRLDRAAPRRAAQHAAATSTSQPEVIRAEPGRCSAAPCRKRRATRCGACDGTAGATGARLAPAATTPAGRPCLRVAAGRALQPLWTSTGKRFDSAAVKRAGVPRIVLNCATPSARSPPRASVDVQHPARMVRPPSWRRR